jgi:hypothetical protein
MVRQVAGLRVRKRNTVTVRAAISGGRGAGPINWRSLALWKPETKEKRRPAYTSREVVIEVQHRQPSAAPEGGSPVAGRPPFGRYGKSGCLGRGRGGLIFSLRQALAKPRDVKRAAMGPPRFEVAKLTL